MSEKKEDIDEKMIAMLTDCDQFITDQKDLSKSLSDGFIFMKRCKVNGNSTMFGIDDIREDIDPSVTCDNIDSTPSLLSKNKGEIYLFSALPAPTLRKAQDRFISTLPIINRMAEAARKVLEIVEEIDKRRS